MTGLASDQFTIEDEKMGEGIQLHFYADSIARIATVHKGRGGSDPEYRVEYSLVDGIGGYRNLVSTFVRGGCAALEQHGPWMSDAAEFERAPAARRRVVPAGARPAGEQDRLEWAEAHAASLAPRSPLLTLRIRRPVGGHCTNFWDWNFDPTLSLDDHLAISAGQRGTGADDGYKRIPSRPVDHRDRVSPRPPVCAGDGQAPGAWGIPGTSLARKQPRGQPSEPGG